MESETHRISASPADRLGGRPVIVAHPRRHHLYQTALAYEEVGRLEAFLTTVFVGYPGILAGASRTMPERVADRLRRLAGYTHPDLRHRAIVLQGGVKRVALSMLGARTRATRSDRSFAAEVADVAHATQSAVHMPCMQAMEAFEQLQGCGLPLVLEQYIADRMLGARLMREECERWGLAFDEKIRKSLGATDTHLRTNDREIELADIVVAGSPFVRDSMIARGVPESKVVLAVYGADTDAFTPAPFLPRKGPLQVAFVGRSHVRKGLLYLLEAAKRVGPDHVHVNVFGESELDANQLMPFQAVATFHGDVPSSTMPDHLRCNHVMALPSLWEGNAYATSEALATGLPVIVTSNTGTSITHAREGMIVPIRDVHALVAALEALLDDGLRAEMSAAAVRFARGRTWATYRSDLRAQLGLAGR